MMTIEQFIAAMGGMEKIEATHKIVVECRCGHECCEGWNVADAYYGEGTHPHCNEVRGHTCQKPSGRICLTTGCNRPAGTAWGPYWCPDHDAERIDRISRQFADIMEQTGNA